MPPPTPIPLTSTPPRRLAPSRLAFSNVRRSEDVSAGGVPWRVYGVLVSRAWPVVLVFALAALTISPLIALFANLLLAEWWVGWRAGRLAGWGAAGVCSARGQFLARSLETHEILVSRTAPSAHTRASAHTPRPPHTPPHSVQHRPVLCPVLRPMHPSRIPALVTHHAWLG